MAVSRPPGSNLVVRSRERLKPRLELTILFLILGYDEGERVIRIEHIFVSPGHNYFGHHDQPPGTHGLVEVDEVECVPGRGLRGDRFFDFKVNYKGQVTFFATEVFDRLVSGLSLPADASPGSTRRNVITSGVDLNTLVGKEFEIQGVRFEGMEECRPCHWMNHAYKDQRTEQFLKGNGGLRARILTHGFLRKG